MPTILSIDSSLSGTGLVRLIVAGPDEIQLCIDKGALLSKEPPYPYWPALATVRAPVLRKGDKSQLTTSRRIQHVIEGIEAAILDGKQGGMWLKPDLIVLEEIPYGAQGDAKHKLTWLWGRVIDLVRSYDIPLLLVNVAAIKQFATGKGNASKDEVMLAMVNRYGGAGFIEGTSTPKPTITNNNEADALAAGMIGARYLGCPVDTAPKENLKCMAKVALQ